jgi:DNA-binding transcriptional LysR family regulator
LYSNIIDIALSYNELDQQGFQSQLLGALQLVLVAPKNIAESYNAAETPYIHVDWGESFNLFIARKFSDKQPRIMQTDNAQTAEQLLMHLNACAYLPSVVLDYAKDLTAIDKRKAPVFKRRIYACYSDDNRHQKDIDAMVDALYL